MGREGGGRWGSGLTDLFGTKIVEGCDEDCEGGVYADNPGEGEEIVEG